MSEISPEDNVKIPQDSPQQEYRLVPVHGYNEFDVESEIDVMDLILQVWNNRQTILRFLAFGTVIGIIFILLTPSEFKSESKLLPEYSTGSQGGAASLLERYGGLLGISSSTYNSSSNAIRVDLYPEIVSSVPFQMELGKTEFYIEKYDTTASLIDYYYEIKNPTLLTVVKNYTIGLPGKIINWITSLGKADDEDLLEFDSQIDSGTDISIVNLSKAERRVASILSEKVSANLDQTTGIITVSAIMDEPVLSAEVTDRAIDELTDYLIQYRTEKLRTDLAFIQQQLDEAKIRFEESQQELAAFREQFPTTVSIRNQTEQQRLNSEYQIAFNLYNTFTQRLEETKLKLQEETPLFKVLEPVKVPVQDESSGVTTLIIFMFLSTVIGVIWIFAVPVLIKLKNHINQASLT